MPCPCGGDLLSRAAERSKHQAVLDYQECRTCGRVGRETLLLYGEPVLTGYPARENFREIDAESVKALWEEHQKARLAEGPNADPLDEACISASQVAEERASVSEGPLADAQQLPLI